MLKVKSASDQTFLSVNKAFTYVRPAKLKLLKPGDIADFFFKKHGYLENCPQTISLLDQSVPSPIDVRKLLICWILHFGKYSLYFKLCYVLKISGL